MIENTIAIKILGADEDCVQIEEIVRAMLAYMSLAGEIEKAQAAGGVELG